MTPPRRPHGRLDAIAQEIEEAPGGDSAGLARRLRTLADELAVEALEAERLRHSEERFRELFHAAHDGIFLIDPADGEILEVNDQSCRMLGYGRDELVGRSIRDLHPYELELFRRFAAVAVEEGRHSSSELTCRARWGELIPVELAATVVVVDGRPALLVIVRDLRHHRLAEIGLAVVKIGHDLRNILASAQLLAGRLGHSDDPETRRVAPAMLDAIDRAIGMCTDTLLYGRAREERPRRLLFDLHPIVEDAARAAGLPVAGTLAWRNEVAPGTEIDADPDQVFRILMNVLRNARDALGGEGRLRVASRRSAGVLDIDIEDDGPGVPEDVRAHLFEPFSAGGRQGQTGLGLTIARDLARGHGGDLVLARSDSRGTLLRLTIPQDDRAPPGA